MRRGEIWRMAGGEEGSRIVVIVQDEAFDATHTITVCAFTSEDVEAPLLRLPIAPTPQNRLFGPARLMVDRVTTVPKIKLGSRLGRLDDRDMQRLDQALLVFLGLARPRRARRD